MYHVNAQGVDERMINVHYYYYAQELTVSACAWAVNSLVAQSLRVE